MYIKVKLYTINIDFKTPTIYYHYNMIFMNIKLLGMLRLKTMFYNVNIIYII